MNLLLFHKLRESFRARFRARLGNTKRDPLAIYLFEDAELTGQEETVRKNCADWSSRGGKYKIYSEESGGYGGLLLKIEISRSR